MESTGEFRAPEYSFHFIKAMRPGGERNGTVFEGMVGSLALKRECKGRTLISPDLIEATTGIDLARIVSSVKFPGEELEAVRLENHQFERLFRVETTNAVEARTILTPLAMEGLVHFRDNFQALPSIAVSQNLAGVRISGTMPYEPIKLDGHLRSLDGYINSLKTACGMLDSLKNIIK